VHLFDQAISARESKAAHRMRDYLAERAKSGEGRHLAALDGSYGYLRQFIPQVLDGVEFVGGTAATELLEAVRILRHLNATGARKVPDEAPTGFVPARWRGYLDTAAKSGNTSAYRHYWELCTLLALRDGLRTGDVFVHGSRRYSDPAAYLLTPSKWADHRVEFCRLVSKLCRERSWDARANCSVTLWFPHGGDVHRSADVESMGDALRVRAAARLRRGRLRALECDTAPVGHFRAPDSVLGCCGGAGGAAADRPGVPPGRVGDHAGDVNHFPVGDPPPDWSRIPPYNLSSRTLPPLEPGGPPRPNTIVGETLRQGGLIDVAAHLADRRGDAVLRGPTGKGLVRVDQIHVAPPLLPAVLDVRPVDSGDASDHSGLVATFDLDTIDAEELTWI